MDNRYCSHSARRTVIDKVTPEPNTSIGNKKKGFTTISDVVKSVEDYVVVMMLDCKRVTITHRDGGSAIISNMAHTKNSRACSERTTLMWGETR